MLMSVATKIAIQLNCKLGGEVWHLEIPVCKLIYILKIFLGFIGEIGVSLSSTFIVVFLYPLQTKFGGGGVYIGITLSVRPCTL